MKFSKTLNKYYILVLRINVQPYIKLIKQDYSCYQQAVSRSVQSLHCYRGQSLSRHLPGPHLPLHRLPPLQETCRKEHSQQAVPLQLLPQDLHNTPGVYFHCLHLHLCGTWREKSSLVADKLHRRQNLRDHSDCKLCLDLCFKDGTHCFPGHFPQT